MITSAPIVIGSYIAGALLLIGGLGVVLLRSWRAASVAFVFCLAMVAALAWLLDAPVLAVVQLAVALVAAGGLVRGEAPSDGGRSFSAQLIPGAIAAVAVLAGMTIVVLRSTFGVFEPGTGTTWREYLVGGIVAILTGITVVAGVVTLAASQARQPRPTESPSPARRPRGRR